MITFEHPLLLLLLIPVAVLPWAHRVLVARFRSWKHAPFSSLSIVLQEGVVARTLTRLPRVLVYTVLVTCIVAWANPRGSTTVVKLEDRGYRIAFAFDVSGSMNGPRLETAKKASITLVRKRTKDVFAVIPFNATVLFTEGVPFTTDHELVAETIKNLDAKGSTAVGDGLLAAFWLVLADLFQVYEMKELGNTLISYDDLMQVLSKGTDGERDTLIRFLFGTFGTIDGAFIVAATDEELNSGISLASVIRFAGRLGVPMYIIGVSTGESSTFGNLLRENGGGYFNAHSEADIANMYATIDRLRPERTAVVTQVEYVSGRPHLLLFAAVCFVVLAALRSTFLVIE